MNINLFTNIPAGLFFANRKNDIRSTKKRIIYYKVKLHLTDKIIFK